MSMDTLMKEYYAAAPELQQAAIKAALDALHGKKPGGDKKDDGDWVMSREEVAAKFKCSPKTVSRYAKDGTIRRICFGKKGKRASNGYSAKSVEAALAKSVEAAPETATA